MLVLRGSGHPGQHEADNRSVRLGRQPGRPAPEALFRHGRHDAPKDIRRILHARLASRENMPRRNRRRLHKRAGRSLPVRQAHQRRDGPRVRLGHVPVPCRQEADELQASAGGALGTGRNRRFRIKDDLRNGHTPGSNRNGLCQHAPAVRQARVIAADIPGGLAAGKTQRTSKDGGRAFHGAKGQRLPDPADAGQEPANASTGLCA